MAIYPFTIKVNQSMIGSLSSMFNMNNFLCAGRSSSNHAPSCIVSLSVNVLQP